MTGLGLELLPGPLSIRIMFYFCFFAYKYTFFSPQQCLWLHSSLDIPRPSLLFLPGRRTRQLLCGGRAGRHFGVSSQSSHKALQRVVRHVLASLSSPWVRGPVPCKSRQHPSPGLGWSCSRKPQSACLGLPSHSTLLPHPALCPLSH